MFLCSVHAAATDTATDDDDDDDDEADSMMWDDDVLQELDSEGRCVVTDHGLFVLINVYAPAYSMVRTATCHMFMLHSLRQTRILPRVVVGGLTPAGCSFLAKRTVTRLLLMHCSVLSDGGCGRGRGRGHVVMWSWSWSCGRVM